VPADGITRGQDIVGSDNILAWLQSYPNQYDYKSHEVIAGAVDEQNNSAFSFFLDQVGAACETATHCCCCRLMHVCMQTVCHTFVHRSSLVS
jgi:hypothetical protein